MRKKPTLVLVQKNQTCENPTVNTLQLLYNSFSFFLIPSKNNYFKIQENKKETSLVGHDKFSCDCGFGLIFD